MSSAISFLETMGRTPGLLNAAKPALYSALSDHAVDQAAGWAILTGNATGLTEVLRARTHLVCGLVLPDCEAAEMFDSEVRLLAKAS